MSKKNNLLYLGLYAATMATANADTIPFEEKHRKVIESIIWAADKAEVPRHVLLALCWNESSFRTDGVTHLDGSSFSYGICQVKLKTALFMDQVYKHKVIATPERLETLHVNAFYAAKYLKYQLNKYNQNIHMAVDGYNKGVAINIQSRYVKNFNKSYQHMVKTVSIR